jgi:hypothetical protein
MWQRQSSIRSGEQKRKVLAFAGNYEITIDETLTQVQRGTTTPP